MQALGSCQRAGQEDAEHLAQPELGRVHGSGAGRLHAEDGVSRLRRGLPSRCSEEGHLQADREMALTTGTLTTRSLRSARTRRIPIRRKEFVQKVTFYTSMNVMRKTRAQIPLMMDNQARIFTLGV